MKKVTYLLPLLILGITVLVTSCGEDPPASERVSTTPSSSSNPPPSADTVPKTKEQLKTIITNAKKWKAAGHSYADLNVARAIADGIVPKEMVIDNGITHLFGGPAVLGIAPENAGVPNSFLVVFSGVPNESCVKLAFPPDDSYLVYAGTFLKSATSEAEAQSNCTTGNMWFVAK